MFFLIFNYLETISFNSQYQLLNEKKLEENPGPLKLSLEDEKRVKYEPSQDWDEYTTKAVDDTIWLEDPENGELKFLTKPENYIASQGNESIVNYLWKR